MSQPAYPPHPGLDLVFTITPRPSCSMYYLNKPRNHARFGLALEAEQSSSEER